MAETNKQAQPTQPDRAENKSIYDKPLYQKKTEEGETDKNPEPGAAYNHTLDEYEKGDQVTDGMNKV